MKNLAEVPKSEQLEFLNSFDHVLSDLDGVVWLLFKPLPNSAPCIDTLTRNGKKVHFVTNNSTVSLEGVKSKLNLAGITVEVTDIITPLTALLSYLKEINFSKKLYTIGSKSIRNALSEEGYNVVEGPHTVEETLPNLLAELNDDENVGAVFIDFNLNLSYMQLQKAVAYIKRKDCLFIAGAGDSRLPITPDKYLIGPHYFLKSLIEFSGRQPFQIAKPSVHYNKFIKQRFNISNPERVLFVGDSVTEDMNFAHNCGYQKLLVLSGLTKLDDVLNWKYPEEFKPQYYVENLNALNKIICDCLPTQQE